MLMRLFANFDQNDYENPNGVLFDLYKRLKRYTGKTQIDRGHIPLLYDLLQRSAKLGYGQVIDLGDAKSDQWVKDGENSNDYYEYNIKILRNSDKPKEFILTLTEQTVLPGWLSNTDIFIHQYKGTSKQLTSIDSIPIYPAVKIQTQTKFSEYRCTGQKQAVEAAICAPYGSTLIVNLPTGTGKSFVFESFAKVHPGQLTIVIVPTTALGQDFKQRFEGFGENILYRGGLERKIRDQIKNDIKNGQQRLLITSPEALLGTFRFALEIAARRGHLAGFIIDEAHMVTQWGESFRTDFQLLSILYRTLKNISPHQGFKTILLSATFTQKTVQQLFHLFPGIERTRTESNICLGNNTDLTMLYPEDHSPINILISASTLRPEIDFHTVKCDSESERFDRLYELLKFVPKPFIVYTSLRERKEQTDDSTTWKQSDNPDFQGTIDIHRYIEKHTKLKTEHVVGGFSQTKLNAILKKWNNREVDGIVATSAFGMGIDMPNVRTIIHACVPEDIDRFYQEVGRSGRDGKAATSIIMHTPDDINTAKGMSRNKHITWNRAAERFMSMLTANRTITTQSYLDKLNQISTQESKWIRCDTSQKVRFGDPTNDNSANSQWHFKTLLMMAKVGLVNNYNMVLTPFQENEQQDEQQDEHLDEQTVMFNINRYIDIELCEPLHNLLDNIDNISNLNTVPQPILDTFINHFKKYYSNTGQQHGFQTLQQYLNGTESLSDLLTDFYTFTWNTLSIECAQQNISCPKSRQVQLSYEDNEDEQDISYHPYPALKQSQIAMHYRRPYGITSDFDQFPWLAERFNTTEEHTSCNKSVLVSYNPDNDLKEVPYILSFFVESGLVQVSTNIDEVINSSKMIFASSPYRTALYSDPTDSNIYYIPCIAIASDKSDLDDIFRHAKTAYPWSIILAPKQVWHESERAKTHNASSLVEFTELKRQIQQFRRK